MTPTRRKPEQERELRILANTTKCRHFRGIQHDTCLAGINTRELVGGADLGWACRMPCITLTSSHDQAECASKSCYTRAESVSLEAEVDESIKAFLENLSSGKCPICKKEVKQRQVGHCVYGTCGHRLYQGKVNPEFAEAR